MRRCHFFRCTPRAARDLHPPVFLRYLPATPVLKLMGRGSMRTRGSHRTMRHVFRHAGRAAVLAAGLLAITAGARGAATEDPKVTLSRRLAAMAVKLRTTRDADERAELREEIEWTKHQLGPTDAAGRRIACGAMWHDAALRDLEQTIRRAAGAGTGPAGRFRLALQQMAAAALARGWADPDGVDRYRFDAVGMYICTHLERLEGLLARAAKHLTSAGKPVLPPPGADESSPAAGADKPAPAGEAAAGASKDAGAEAAPAAADAPPADARAQALALVQDGLGRLVRAADQAHAADRSTKAGRGEQHAALVALVDAVSDIHRATAALDAAGPTGPVVLPPEEMPGLTEAHEAALREAGDLIAGIESAPWQEIRDSLATLLATAEVGLKHPRARCQAERLLQVVARTAGYIRGLLASRMALPEHVADQREQIAEALEDLKNPAYRQSQYRLLLRIAGGDSLRRILDASGLSPEGGRGLLRLRQLPPDTFPGKEGSSRRAYFLEDVEATIRALAQAKGDPPAGIDPHFASLYAQTGAALREAAEELGANPPADPVLLRQRAAETAAYAGDLARLERAGRVVHAARTLMGDRADPFCEALEKRLESFVLAPSADHRDARRGFDTYLSAVGGLAHLRMPGKAHTRAALRLSGGAYRSAAERFGEKLTRNLASAAQGDPEYLELTLGAAPMFTLLRHRVVAEEAGLQGVDPAGLAPFALPPKPWKVYVSTLDRRLAALLKSYGAIRGWSRGSATGLSRWDDVYCTVVAAQHVTRESGGGKDDPLDRLVAHLEQAAEPRIEPDVWVGWATGYHTLEAAICLVGGYPATAGEHLRCLYYLRRRLGGYPATAGEHLRCLYYLRRRYYLPNRLTWRVFDPLE